MESWHAQQQTGGKGHGGDQRERDWMWRENIGESLRENKVLGCLSYLT